MSELKHMLELVGELKHSPSHNYAIPGLTSWLVGQPTPAGCVRLFECDREHQEPITPHSHRFDFRCLVLKGSVRNRIWIEADYMDEPGCDMFMKSVLQYGGEMGAYTQSEQSNWPYCFSDAIYKAGDTYSMRSHQIHSIYFSRGASVLFYEGPKVCDESVILEPFVQGARVPTFKVEPWMFKRGAA